MASPARPSLWYEHSKSITKYLQLSHPASYWWRSENPTHIPQLLDLEQRDPAPGTLLSGLQHVTTSYLLFAEGPSLEPKAGAWGTGEWAEHVWLTACVPSPLFPLLPVSGQ